MLLEHDVILWLRTVIRTLFCLNIDLMLRPDVFSVGLGSLNFLLLFLFRDDGASRLVSIIDCHFHFDLRLGELFLFIAAMES